MGIVFSIPLVMLPGIHEFNYVLCVGHDVNAVYRSSYTFSPRLMFSKVAFQVLNFIVILLSMVAGLYAKLGDWRETRRRRREVKDEEANNNNFSGLAIRRNYANQDYR